jgi:hypothetical protein
VGRFDDVEEPQKPAPESRAQRPHLAQVVAIARSIPEARGMKTRAYRRALVDRLTAAGWSCRTLVWVESRGTDDGYRGKLDLVAHPPRPPGAHPGIPLDPPVLIEIDKRSIQRKTFAKLARWEGPHSGKAVILTRAASHPGVSGLDVVVGLA